MGTVLVTGAAGFIGFHLVRRLLDRGEDVIGIDTFNDYYDPKLKEARAAQLKCPSFRLIRMDFAESGPLADLVRGHDVRRVVHLGAQAGVRYSINNPFAYERSNLAGHLSVLEACRGQERLEHLVYASSSSVYGDRPITSGAFHEDDRVDNPASLYAATKRACEIMSTTYSGLYGLQQSGLRFFTVYGPWGRPDMAYYSFAERICRGHPIEVYGDGLMQRDFTYIDDILDGIVGVLDRPPSHCENRLLNIGNDQPEGLMTLITILEEALGQKAEKIMRPKQSGDVAATWADVSRIRILTGYDPKVKLVAGISRFVDWFRNYKTT